MSLAEAYSPSLSINYKYEFISSGMHSRQQFMFLKQSKNMFDVKQTDNTFTI
jgi:glutaredoxin-related protein